MKKWFIPLCATLLVLLLTSPTISYGQGGTGGGGGGGGGGGTGGGGTGGGAGAGTGGVEIDAQGVLRTKLRTAFDGRLDRQLARAAKAANNEDYQKSSGMRMISLVRLEQAAREKIEAGQPLTDELRYLAGMTRVTNVFFFPDDIVIAGPAEGCFVNSQNRVVGIETGASTLQLEDLVVALRTFGPSGQSPNVISVSIDPRPEGSAAYNQVFGAVGTAFLNGQLTIDQVRSQLIGAMGMNDITIKGVSDRTRFSQVMTEADYRMKLIGIGLEQPAVKINNYFDNMPMIAGAGGGLTRWFFQPNYECVLMNQDETSMEINGNGVKLVTEEDRLDNSGNKVGTGKANKASRNFCASFSKEFDKLAARDSLFGELRNLIDLSISAAFIQKMDLYSKANWKMSFFGDESKFQTERFNSPKQVEPVLNVALRDGAFSAPIAGGVNIQPKVALSTQNVKSDDAGKIAELKKKVGPANLKDGQWWWDVESETSSK